METITENSSKKRLRTLLVVLVIFAAGAATGFFVGRAIDGGGKQASKTRQPGDAPKSTKATQETIKDNSAKLKERIKSGVESKNITKEQSDMLLKKLDEVDKFNKSLLSKSTQEQSSLVLDKRKELREWASSNKIPLSYVATMVVR